MVSSVVLSSIFVHEYGPDTFFTERITGQLVFNFIRVEQIFLQEFSSPLAMSYDKFCTVPYRKSHVISN